jgi:RND family efflux transporter MFP subunit
MNGNSLGHKGLRLAGLLPLSITLVAFGCSPPASTRSDVVRPVKTMVVSAGDETHSRSFPGKVEASKKVELSFQVPGLLEKFRLKEGDSVKKGDVIAMLRQKDFEIELKKRQEELGKARTALRSLRSGERPEQQRALEARVRATEAELANARTELERDTMLLRTGSVPQATFDLSQTKFRRAQEEHRIARQNLEKGLIGREEDVEAKEAAVRGLEVGVVEAKLHLDDATLRAPYDGQIAKRLVEENQTVKAKQPIVQFQDVDEIDVAVDVPETFMAADLGTADVIEIVAEFTGAPGLRFPVHVTEVAQAADPVTQTFRARVSMQAPDGIKLRTGMSAVVTFTYRRAGILGSPPVLVPIAAVFKDATGEQAAWVVGPDQTVKSRPVKLGAAAGDRVEVVDGLLPGDRVAVAGATHLREGMKVRDLGDALGGVRP